VSKFGLTNHEGAAIVGEARVYNDGSWEASVPPYLPYHLQPIDEFGMSIRNQMLWIQAMPGEARRCGGCHASRSENVLPRMGVTTLAQQAGPQDFNKPIPDRTELPWMGATDGTRNIQDIFDDSCVSCHNGGSSDPFAGRSFTVEVTGNDGITSQYQVPYLLLTSAPIEVEYMNDVVEYPASYVTLLYTSALTGDAIATGDTPPSWVVPGSARQSALIQAININSEDDAGKWAFDTPSHPEDVGVTLTREDRQALIQVIDLGGQYYTRRNVEGAAYWAGEEY
jgi:hypothetical protein